MNVYSVRLPQRTQGATASPIRARFLLPDGTVVDLTGATITATKKNINTDAPVTSITGTVAPDVGEAADGWFNWDLSADDVGESGLFLVQFRATGGVAFDATSQGEWYLHPLQDAQAVASPAIVGVTSVQRCAMDNANAPDCANPFATMADVGTGGIPLIDPAVAGNLAVQTAGGEVVDAGYAADENATDGTVVRRRGDGRISAKGVGGGTGAFEANVPTGFGAYSFLTRKNNVERSAIESDNGTLIFLGASADANRLAQTNEVQAVSFGGAQTITAPQQTQARANINAETAGAAATVQGNLNTHTGLTGTAVHGLGTISTQAANNVSISGGSVTGITDLAVADGGTGASTVDGARANLLMASSTLPSKKLVHYSFPTWTNTLTGSGAGAASTTPLFVQDLSSGATALSTVRRSVADNASVGRVGFGQFADWSRRMVFVVNMSFVVLNAEGICRVFFGKTTAAAFGLAATGNYVAVELTNNVITGLHVCKAGVVSSSATSSTLSPIDNITIVSQNGTVELYKNSILLAQTANGPNVLSTGGVHYEVQNGATAANYRAFIATESEAF
jgi:hypothetical protein